MGSLRFSRYRSINRIALAFLVWEILFVFPAFAQKGLEEIDAYISRSQKEWPVPGLAVAIVKDSAVVFEKGYGVRRQGSPDPVDENTLFAIASNTKAFTAAALAILVDEKKINWNDPVRTVLPYFELYDPYVLSDMRIRDLLSHRSGLGTFSGDLLWYGTSYSPEEVVRRVRFLKPAFPFRSGYGYSNVMFITAGEIIPAVTNRSWADFIKERIFDPLGMNRTITSVRDLANMQNVATPHKPTTDAIIPLEWYNWDNMAAAGGIISSVHDVSQWLRLQLGHGSFEGTEVFSGTRSHEMWTPHNIIPLNAAALKRNPDTHFTAYGLGWNLMDYRGRLIVSHGGGYDGMYSRVVLVPEEHLGIVVLTNSMTGLQTAITNRILDHFLDAGTRDWSKELLEQQKQSLLQNEERVDKIVREQIPDTKLSLALRAYTGTYKGEMYGDATISLDNGHLVLKMLPNKDFVADLTHLHFDTFLLKWRKEFAFFDEGTVQFLLDSSGNVQEMRIDVPNDDLWFTELEFKKKQ